MPGEKKEHNACQSHSKKCANIYVEKHIEKQNT